MKTLTLVFFIYVFYVKAFETRYELREKTSLNFFSRNLVFRNINAPKVGTLEI